MWLFSFFLIPILYVFNFFKTRIMVKSYLHFGIGLLLGIFYSILTMLLHSPREYVTVKLSAIFISNWILFVLPLVILLGLTLLISAKPFLQRLLLAVDICAGFYTIFIPFYILTYFNSYTLFSLFFLPVLFALTLFGISYALSSLVSLITMQSDFLHFFVAILFIIFSLIAASFVYSFWILGFGFFILALSIVFFFAGMIGLFCLYNTFC